MNKRNLTSSVLLLASICLLALSSVMAQAGQQVRYISGSADVNAPTYVEILFTTAERFTGDPDIVVTHTEEAVTVDWPDADLGESMELRATVKCGVGGVEVVVTIPSGDMGFYTLAHTSESFVLQPGGEKEVELMLTIDSDATGGANEISIPITAIERL